MPSGKLKKKDMIKVEGRFLEDDTNRLAVIAPSSTVNIIKDYKLVEKEEFHYQIRLKIFSMLKPRLHYKQSRTHRVIMEVIDKDKLVLKCRYVDGF